jgi:hypothetical protein
MTAETARLSHREHAGSAKNLQWRNSCQRFPAYHHLLPPNDRPGACPAIGRTDRPNKFVGAAGSALALLAAMMSKMGRKRCSNGAGQRSKKIELTERYQADTFSRLGDI